jgi:hypothetical protein
MGSIVAARHEGTMHAAAATNTRTEAEASRVIGSRELPPAQDVST